MLTRALQGDPGQPLLTQYDQRTGERVELSVATVENWIAKTANLLQETGLEPGATAAVLLPAHWQTAVVLLGCFRAGVSVAPPGEAADVAFASADRVDEALKLGADEVWALSLAPLAAPLREVPPGALDYATEVRGQADRFVPYAPAEADETLFGALSVTDAMEDARERAAALNLPLGGRLLITASDDVDQPPPRDWLLAPLSVGASVVLVLNAGPDDVARITTDERATTTLA